LDKLGNQGKGGQEARLGRCCGGAIPCTVRREGWGLLNGGNVAVAVVLELFSQRLGLFGFCGGKDMLKDKMLELLVFVDSELG